MASAQRFVNVRDSYNLNSRLTYRFDVFGIRNTAMVGNDNQWVTQRYPQVNGSANQSGPTAPFVPRTTAPSDGSALVANSPAPFNSLRDTLQYFQGTYIVDQLALLNDTLFVVIGERYTNFKQHVTYPYRPDLQATRQPDALAKKWTPQLGALYKLFKGFALYGSYAEAVIPQTQIDASGKTVLPIDATGYDLGAKVDLLDGAFTGTVAYYRLHQTNTAIADAAQNIAHGLPANATFGYYTYGNAQQVRGVQVDLSYNVSREYQLVAGANRFLQAEFVTPQSNPINIGIPIAYQPKTMYTVWNRYQASSGALKGVILGGGLHYNSRASFGGDFNHSQLYIPAFTVFDALIGYDFKLLDHAVQFRVNAKNIADKKYRDGAGGAFNTPRTVILSLSTRF